MTKKITTVIGLGTARLLSDPAFAQTNSQTGTTTPVVIPINRKDLPDKTDRPKSPSRQYINCVYTDGCITVSFLFPEGEATMSVTDLTTGSSSQYMLETSEAIEIYTGILPAAYIYIGTEQGHSYEGEFNLNN